MASASVLRYGVVGAGGAVLGAAHPAVQSFVNGMLPEAFAALFHPVAAGAAATAVVAARADDVHAAVRARGTPAVMEGPALKGGLACHLLLPTLA